MNLQWRKKCNRQGNHAIRCRGAAGQLQVSQPLQVVSSSKTFPIYFLQFKNESRVQLKGLFFPGFAPSLFMTKTQTGKWLFCLFIIREDVKTQWEVCTYGNNLLQGLWLSNKKIFWALKVRRDIYWEVTILLRNTQCQKLWGGGEQGKTLAYPTRQISMKIQLETSFNFNLKKGLLIFILD